jgi:3-hydroxybutyryl-CoA dehydratase
MIGQRQYELINVGDKASVSKTISEWDVYTFAGLTGDYNPVHINTEFAKDSMFGQRIAHGMLTASFISTILGTTLPGVNTIYLSQELKFKKPVFYGDTITAEVEVLEKDDNRRTLDLKTVVINQKGDQVIEGKAKVMLPKGKTN